MRSQTVLFISAGMIRPKKRDHPLARRQLYLNYGALTLATKLTLSGRSAHLIHGEHEEPDLIVRHLMELGLLPSAFPIMLSLPSFYALTWAQAFCRSLRAFDDDAKIIVGGRWVTGPNPDWLQSLIPEADRVVAGMGEAIIENLLENPFESHVSGLTAGLPDFGLNHRLVAGFESYQPSIETSRGCGMGCAFCEEREIPLTKLRDPARLVALMAATQQQYAGGVIRPYLQSSFFLPSTSWATRMRNAVRAAGLNISWRCETRVDAMTPETVEQLAAAGMKVIDLGMETASPTQILAMKKSRKPDQYLRLASDLINACHANGVWVKANVLLYAGETAHTINETQAWLDDHATAIKGVSVGPVLVFGPHDTTSSFSNELIQLGARLVDPDSADSTGITHIHPSSEIDVTAAEVISLDLSRRYMDANSYFDLKSFSYYPRDYVRHDFDADISSSSKELLPFRT